MSNVRIVATGEIGLLIAVNLGPNERAVHECAAGESIELTVGGNQSLSVTADSDSPTADAEDTSMPTGADVVEGVVDAEPPTHNDIVQGAGEGPVSDSPLNKGDPLRNPFDPEVE